MAPNVIHQVLILLQAIPQILLVLTVRCRIRRHAPNLRTARLIENAIVHLLLALSLHFHAEVEAVEQFGLENPLLLAIKRRSVKLMLLVAVSSAFPLILEIFDE